METITYLGKPRSSAGAKEPAKPVMALLGIPRDASSDWFAGQISCRTAEALSRGVSEEQARNRTAAWGTLIEGVIAWSAGR